MIYDDFEIADAQARRIVGGGVVDGVMGGVSQARADRAAGIGRRRRSGGRA